MENENNKTINQEEITKALSVIRDVCINFHCDDCPFSKGSDFCVFIDSTIEPCGWEINFNKKWKAFID